MWNIVYVWSVKMFVLHFVSSSENIFAENLSGTGVIRLHCLQASFLDPIPNVSTPRVQRLENNVCVQFKLDFLLLK